MTGGRSNGGVNFEDSRTDQVEMLASHDGQNLLLFPLFTSQGYPDKEMRRFR
jgi:hypothetical protein